MPLVSPTINLAASLILPCENEDKIVNYLKNGVICCVSPCFVWDVLDKNKGIVDGLRILTDGVWEWPSDLPYYVANYHVSLNKDFIFHMMQNNWTIPDKNEINMEALEL